MTQCISEIINVFGLMRCYCIDLISRPRRRCIRKLKLGNFQLLMLLAALTMAVFVIVRSYGGSGGGLGKYGEAWRSHPIMLEDVKQHANPHKFSYLSNPTRTCLPDDEVELLVLVASAVTHTDRREAIRNTWGRRDETRARNVRVVFMLGQGEAEDGDQEDMLQEDFVDTYHNLTIKTMMGLKWAAIFCPRAKFVLKTDDDIFVNVQLLVDEIRERGKSISNITGCIKNGAGAPQPIPQSGGPHLPSLPPAHPAFAAGAGYLLRGHLVPKLYLASLDLRLFPVEDVFTTAHCARKVGGGAHPPAHDARFSCGQMAAAAEVDECGGAEGSFTVHKVTPSRMAAIARALEKGRCSKARKDRD